jgi:hypothetical protein
MAASTSHQLVATRGLEEAPSTIIAPATPTLHQFVDGEFLSGSNPWPVDTEEQRIDRISGISWEKLKRSMMGCRS